MYNVGRNKTIRDRESIHKPILESVKSKNIIMLFVIILLSAFQVSSDLSGQTIVEQPPMYYGDTTRNGDPFSKDPSAIYYQGRYLLYYSMLSSTNPDLPEGWAIGIADSYDMVNWNKVGDILPVQDCEKNGIVNLPPHSLTIFHIKVDDR